MIKTLTHVFSLIKFNTPSSPYSIGEHNFDKNIQIQRSKKPKYLPTKINNKIKMTRRIRT